MRYPAAWLVFVVVVTAVGCQSPYHSDQGALYGGLTGAGLGALVGNASGNPGAGAAIGAGVGALSGAAVGGALDDIEARNRAEIEARLGRNVAPGAVTIADVVAMTRAGVNDDLIINHVNAHGMVAPLQAGDLIALQQQGVNTRVIAAMQAPPPGPPPAGPPVIVEGPVVPPPYYYYGPPHPYYRHWRPRTSIGVAIAP